MDKIIGHEDNLKFLERGLKTGRLAQGYLFLGPEHVGKTTTVEWLVGQLCGTTEPLIHPDVTVVTRAVNPKTEVLAHHISVDQIRELRDRFLQTSFSGGWKVAVIAEADHLTLEAANALLKILEEPPGKALIILIASRATALPATIMSRLQTLRFKPVNQDQLLKIPGATKKLAALALGRPGLLVSMLADQGDAAYQEIANFQQLLCEEPWQRLAVIEKWFPKKKAHAENLKEILERLRYWKIWLRDSWRHSYGARALVAVANLGENSSDFWWNWLKATERAERLLCSGANARYVLEELLLIQK